MRVRLTSGGQRCPGSRRTGDRAATPWGQRSVEQNMVLSKDEDGIVAQTSHMSNGRVTLAKGSGNQGVSHVCLGAEMLRHFH